MPATVSVPVRGVPAGLAPTMKFTVPFPVPLPGATLVIQLSPLVAVQAHPGVAMTRMVIPPAAAAADWEVGSIANEHPAACWLTEKV